MTIYGTTKKQHFTNTHLLVEYFDVGIQHQGYWTHDHIALQSEDAYDILSSLYPNYEIVVIMDSSTGHKKKQPTVLT